VPGVGIDTFPGLSIFRERGDPADRPLPPSLPPSSTVFITGSFHFRARILATYPIARGAGGTALFGAVSLDYRAIDRSAGFTSYPREDRSLVESFGESRIRQARARCRCHFLIFRREFRYLSSLARRQVSSESHPSRIPRPRRELDMSHQCCIDEHAVEMIGSHEIFNLRSSPAFFALISRHVAYLERRMRNGKAVLVLLSACLIHRPAGRDCSRRFISILLSKRPCIQFPGCFHALWTMRLIQPDKRLRAFSPSPALPSCPVPSHPAPWSHAARNLGGKAGLRIATVPRPKSASDL